MCEDKKCIELKMWKNTPVTSHGYRVRSPVTGAGVKYLKIRVTTRQQLYETSVTDFWWPLYETFGHYIRSLVTGVFHAYKKNAICRFTSVRTKIKQQPRLLGPRFTPAVCVIWWVLATRNLLNTSIIKPSTLKLKNSRFIIQKNYNI